MKKERFVVRSVALAVALAFSGGAFAQTRATDVSADGSTVVGYRASPQMAYRWTESGGLVELGIDRSAAFSVSGDGAIVVGTVYPVGAKRKAFIWSDGSVSYIELASRDVYANAVSANGNVVVGAVYDSSTYTGYAYRWSGGTLQNLGTLAGDAEAVARGVNSDGSVVVGTSYGTAGTNPRAFRWTTASGSMQPLFTPATMPTGYTYSYGEDVSADGNVVVGYVSQGAYGASRPFRWQSGTVQVLDALPGHDRAAASGVSGDGNVVVGHSSQSSDPASMRGFRWTAAAGTQSINDWLTGAGVSVASGVVARTANATNSDGCVVVGELASGDAYVARVVGGTCSAASALTTVSGGASGGVGAGGGGTSAGVGSGLISVGQVSQSLAQAASAVGIALSQTGLVLQGAHGRPLSRRVGRSQNAFWVAGDLAGDQHGDRDGRLGLAELGLGRNFGPAQLNAAVGYTGAKFDQPLDGQVRQSGTYLFAEGLVPLTANDAGDGLWAVVSGYHHWGDATIRRGYLNAGLPDTSTGTPDTRSWGVSAGLEWHRLLTWGGFSASPYMNFTHARATTEAYTEGGGAWPAAFSAASGSASDLRVGVNFEQQLGGARLIATLEGAHRSNDAISSSTATILGPGGFTVTIPGQRYDRNWLRGALGLEAPLAGGVVTATLNATTAGEMPSYWLAASWRMAF